MFLAMLQLVWLLNHTDAYVSYLLIPFKGVNTKAMGFNVIIFDALCGSLILSSPLCTLGNTYNIYVLNKNICFHAQGNYDGLLFNIVFYANSRK